MIYEILGHGNNHISMILESLLSTEKYTVIYTDINIISSSLTDDTENKCFGNIFSTKRFNIKEINYQDWIPNKKSKKIMGGQNKKATFDFFKQNFNIQIDDYINIIDDKASISSSCILRNGCYIGPNASIGPFATISDFGFINRNATVGHHSKLDKYCTLNPGCNVAGKCILGESVTVGMGANVVDHVCIGSHSVIGASSLVTKSLQSNGVFYGIPAKLIRQSN